MKHRILFTALALAVLATGVAAAAPSETAQRTAKPTLDSNGDGVIDRAEAARSSRLAGHFDRLDRNGDGRLEASERPQHRHARGGKRRRRRDASPVGRRVPHRPTELLQQQLARGVVAFAEQLRDLL